MGLTHRERFYRLFAGEPIDRIPIYFFGTWLETQERWKREGCPGIPDPPVDCDLQLLGMDPDWEHGLWNLHGLVDLYPRGDFQEEVLENNERCRIVRNAVGDIIQYSKQGSSISHKLHYGLQPVRESWEHYKTYLDPNDPSRYANDWEIQAEKLNAQDRVTPLLGGSLYNYLRDYLGVETLSCLMYDDEALLSDMIAYLADYFITLLAPLVKKVKFDFVYFFEDCCGSNGPLFSPACYHKFFDEPYRRMIRFYKENGIPYALIDSDGKIDRLVDCWIGSGFDILFPIEKGVWGQTPGELRQRFGKNLRMMDGVDKFVISKGEDEIRKHLCSLREEVQRGGFLPIPDHRIPPECSYADFTVYLQVFQEVFENVGTV